MGVLSARQYVDVGEMEQHREFVKSREKMEREIDRINAKPSYPWNNTATSVFMQLAGLRGFWTMGSIDSNGDVYDHGGQGRTLTNNGQSATGETAWAAPWQAFDGTNDYLSRADEAGLDISGAETYIGSSYRGLTIGGWFQFSTLPVTGNRGIFSKWNSNLVNQRSYMLVLPNGTSTARFQVSTDLINPVVVTSTLTLSVDTWYFIVGRFDPSTELSITVNGTQNEDTNVAGIPATIANSTADLNVMAFSNGLLATRNHGFSSHCFLTCTLLSDETVNRMFEMSRGMFGV